MRCLAACLVLCSVAACASVQDSGPTNTDQSDAGLASAGLPGPVADALGELTALCRDVGGEPDSDDAVRRADLNADGQDDYVLFAGWIDCAGAWSVFGDREKALLVFAGGGARGASEAFSEAVFNARLESTLDTTTLWLTTSAERCGRPGAPTFAEESFCERPIVPATAMRFEYASLAAVRIIE